MPSANKINAFGPDIYASNDPKHPQNSGTATAPQWNYQYDTQGHLLVITDPKGRSTTNNFDEFGRQARHFLTMGQISSNVFDSRGRLWKQFVS